MSTIGAILPLVGDLSLQLFEEIGYRRLAGISSYNVFRPDSYCAPETPAVIVWPALGLKSEIG
jgi:hypothetical protein